MTKSPTKLYLLASDFDQTLSFNDSGMVLSDLLGISGFEDRVVGLARSNLVQQGGELAYLIRHDPEFRGVRREHLVEAGHRVRLKRAIPALTDFMKRGTGCVSLSASAACMAIFRPGVLLGRRFIGCRDAALAQQLAGAIGSYRFAEMEALRLRHGIG
jgi:hypothetical protein